MRFLNLLPVIMVLGILPISSAHAQWWDLAHRNPALIWQKCLGGTGTDKANDVLMTTDGGMVLVGVSNSTDGDVTGNHGGYDGWVVKLSSSGSIEWQKSLGGSAEDEINSIIKTSDGGYLCLGKTRSGDGNIVGFHGNVDCWITKLTASGDIAWSKAYGGTNDDWVEQAIPLSDGNYMVLATAASVDGDIHTSDILPDADGWLFKINSNGDILWEKGIDAPAAVSPATNRENYGMGLIETNDHRIVAAVSGFKLLDTAFYPPINYEEEIPDTIRFQNIYCYPGMLYWIDPATGSYTYFAETRGSNRRYFSMKAHGNGIYFQYPDNNAWYLECVDYRNWQTEYSYFPTEAITTAYLDLSTGLFSSTFFVTNEVVCPYSQSGGGNPNFFISPHNSLSISPGNKMSTAGYDSRMTRGYTYHADALLNHRNAYRATYGGNGEDGFNVVKALPNDYEMVCAGFAGSEDGDLTGLVHSNTPPNGLGFNPDFWVVKVSTEPNKIVGKVFLDLNNNNIKEDGEPAYARAVIKTTNNGLTKTAGSTNGAYEMVVGVDTFITSVTLENNTFYNIFPTTKTTIFTAPNSVDTVDFAIHPLTRVRDYVITMTALSPARPVRTVTYRMDYLNNGTDTTLQQPVKFIKDSRLSFSTTPVNSIISADTATWMVDSIMPGESEECYITLTVPPIPAVNVGDTLISHVEIDTAGDVASADNFSTIRQPVQTSFDPNDKLEIHAGLFTPYEINGGNYLTYTIRFQNTGNDTAFNIIVRDTLDQALNGAALEMLAASHPYKISVSNGTFITWQFDNINLVDSLHNEPESHGYITYRIKVKNNLIDGDSIFNSASIYFDFNPPVRTNRQITQVQIGKAIWTGTVDDKWENPANWNNNLVPDKDTKVFIPSGDVPFLPVIRQTVTCYSITVAPGASLTVMNGIDLVLRGR